MAAAPRWKIYDAENEYRAACKHVEDAAALVSAIGEGATIRDGHSARSIVWTEGSEDQTAFESYDYVATVVHDRCRERYGRKG